MKFQKILIANRGEIALRVIHAARELGIQTVLVYSESDADSLAVKSAGESYPLKGTEVRETYLDSSQILKIAKAAGVNAIHPGYGFLAENADFAEACAKAKIKFIGPRPETLRLLGDKVAAKKLAAASGVPVLPGYEGSLPRGKDLEKLAGEIGYPLLIKAAAGGGGKGMRVVHESKELEHSLESAEREAEAFFKDKSVFFEKYLERPRHIEVQVLGDEKGNLIHLFERECSIQRRHQKMIEESPSPSIDASTRSAICEAALSIARQANYVSAGTIEFILDEAGNFYFLEANTRLQVEHPITEFTTGLDLVKAQIKIAEGHTLPLSQESVGQHGHAIECRLYAEDPENQFLPAEGMVGVLVEPIRPGIRIDSSLQQGKPILSLYDPMLAKLIVHGVNRKEALMKMDALLRDYVLLGVRHNLDFLRWLINFGPFQEGRYHTHTVAELIPLYLNARGPGVPAPAAAYAVAALASRGMATPKAGAARHAPTVLESGADDFPSLKGFKNV